jgi:DNA-binding GntR family transcriptional regulator
LLLPTVRRFVQSETMTSAALKYHHRILAEIKAGDGEAAALMTKRHVNDFRAAWEHRGLDFHLQVGELARDAGDASGAVPAA